MQNPHSHLHSNRNRYQPTSFYRQNNIPNAQQTPTPPSTPPLASFPLPELILVRNQHQYQHQPMSSSSSSSAPSQSESTTPTSTATTARTTTATSSLLSSSLLSSSSSASSLSSSASVQTHQRRDRFCPLSSIRRNISSSIQAHQLQNRFCPISFQRPNSSNSTSTSSIQTNRFYPIPFRRTTTPTPHPNLQPRISQPTQEILVNLQFLCRDLRQSLTGLHEHLNGLWKEVSDIKCREQQVGITEEEQKSLRCVRRNIENRIKELFGGWHTEEDDDDDDEDESGEEEEEDDDDDDDEDVDEETSEEEDEMEEKEGEND